jgi:acetyl esterase/lipase
VAGLPALWAVPKGSAEDRVILSLHGGFVSGSVYTRRKLYGHLAKAVGARAPLTDYRQSPAHPYPAPLRDRPARAPPPGSHSDARSPPPATCSAGP